MIEGIVELGRFLRVAQVSHLNEDARQRGVLEDVVVSPRRRLHAETVTPQEAHELRGQFSAEPGAFCGGGRQGHEEAAADGGLGRRLLAEGVDDDAAQALMADLVGMQGDEDRASSHEALVHPLVERGEDVFRAGQQNARQKREVPDEKN